jgi:hypothetical protein
LFLLDAILILSFYLSFLQDLVGLVLSILLLGDFSLVLLTLLQMYSISLLDFLLVLFVLPLGLIFPFPAGISALFSHGPRRSAGLARVYALWNITSLINVVSYCQPCFQYSRKNLKVMNTQSHVGCSRNFPVVSKKIFSIPGRYFILLI